MTQCEIADCSKDASTRVKSTNRNGNTTNLRVCNTCAHAYMAGAKDPAVNPNCKPNIEETYMNKLLRVESQLTAGARLDEKALDTRARNHIITALENVQKVIERYNND